MRQQFCENVTNFEQLNRPREGRIGKAAFALLQLRNVTMRRSLPPQNLYTRSRM